MRRSEISTVQTSSQSGEVLKRDIAFLRLNEEKRELTILFSSRNGAGRPVDSENFVITPEQILQMEES